MPLVINGSPPQPAGGAERGAEEDEEGPEGGAGLAPTVGGALWEEGGCCWVPLRRLAA